MKTVEFAYMMGACGIPCRITTDQLMDAIAIVESSRGKTSNNVYQLKPIYVEDVCRITGQRITHAQAIGDDALARACIAAYWNHYGHAYWKQTGTEASAEALARIHNGGPDGWRRTSTHGYWLRVSEALLKHVLKIWKDGAR